MFIHVILNTLGILHYQILVNNNITLEEIIPLLSLLYLEVIYNELNCIELPQEYVVKGCAGLLPIRD